MRLSTWICVLLLCLVSPTSSIPAQGPLYDGATLYRTLAPSVFLVQVYDSAGTVIDFGSAFLVDSQRLVTNAHVVHRGRLALKTGAAAVPLTVERLDVRNDLAILWSATPIEAPALELATAAPPPGTSIWVLGNPKGLERSISDGIVSGVRDRAGRRLLQITAAISQGSSGGPVVDRDGRVVGVTAGFLHGGQNLNFAVPSEFVVSLLGTSAQVTSAPTVSSHAERFATESDATMLEAASGVRRRRPVEGCAAGEDYLAASEIDLALLSLRAFVQASAAAEKMDTTRVVSAHRSIAAMLLRRGVYGQAEQHARQAGALDPKNPWPLHDLSRALLCQDKADEAAAVAEEAIRLSDGRHGAMHFDAGSAYFALKEWAKCARSFELASNLNPKDDSAPYNTALCLAKQGFSVDAARWMETALLRNPARADRSDIEGMIRRWRQ